MPISNDDFELLKLGVNAQALIDAQRADCAAQARAIDRALARPRNITKRAVKKPMRTPHDLANQNPLWSEMLRALRGSCTQTPKL